MEKVLSLGAPERFYSAVCLRVKRMRVLTTCEPRGSRILWSVWGLTDQRRHR